MARAPTTFSTCCPARTTLSIARTGNFGGYTQKNVSVEVNQQVRIDVSLQPASRIHAGDGQPRLLRSCRPKRPKWTAISTRHKSRQLPITSSKGRNYEELYTLIPGAAQVQEKNSIGGNPSRAMSVNVNGNSYNGNTTRIDGAIDYYGWLPYLIAYVTPADAVESVTVTTDDFNAEQGQAGGASIRVTTKSGGHDFHGGGW